MSETETTPKRGGKASAEQQHTTEEIFALSRDATHSTYTAVTPDPEESPPLGSCVEQELGEPAPETPPILFQGLSQ